MQTQTNDATKTRPAFGQRVRIKATAVRRTIFAPTLPPEKSDLLTLVSHYVPDESKRWRVWSRKELPAPVSALCIGYRTLQDGLTRWEGYDVGYVFWHKRNLDACLVVTHPRRNPVLVFPEDVELAE